MNIPPVYNNYTEKNQGEYLFSRAINFASRKFTETKIGNSDQEGAVSNFQ